MRQATRQEKPARGNRGKWFWGTVGGLCLGWASIVGVETWRFQKQAVRTVGHVVGSQERTMSQVRERATGTKLVVSSQITSIIQYGTEEGQQYQMEDVLFPAPASPLPPNGSRKTMLTALLSGSSIGGAGVTVLYDRRHPEIARLNQFFNLWLVPLLWGGIGAMIVTAVIVSVSRERRSFRGI